MHSRQLATVRPQEKTQRELDDLRLVIRARNGDGAALDALMKRYAGFVRLKASSYFIAGGESDDLIQEGLIGLYKAVRDFRSDKETSFRSFAELCITRQIITAIKAATRYKHAALNSYVSFSQTPAGQEVMHLSSASFLRELADEPLPETSRGASWSRIGEALDEETRARLDRLRRGEH